MSLVVYNTITRKKEEFKSINEGIVGMYVCGPTVYGYPHLGHAKSYITFDIIYRYLCYLGYKVKYVQNITDVGHLVGDAESGDDKIQKQALIEKIDPVEIAYKYETIYFENMDALNVKRPSISCRATGHIIEIIDMVKTLIDKGFAYVTDKGNVYFRVNKFPNYGSLKNINLEENLSGERIEVASDKERNEDFALWKKAEDNHLMKWPSPWGEGYPGWHIECSVMSEKYLGKTFDIHGGGMDNIFPHHECEIAQSVSANNVPFVKYFIHNNLVTVNGQKMGKSLGNFITLPDLFKEYDPIIIRFYILQNHYRKPTDINNEQLKTTSEIYKKLVESINKLYNETKNIETNNFTYDQEIKTLKDNFLKAMDDDFNTSLAISYILESSKIINKEINGEKDINKLLSLKDFIQECACEILGLKFNTNNASKEMELIEIISNLRDKMREEKNYELSDKIRDDLKLIGITLNDRK
ncbi:MAG: cysteine--tRNA ligase [Bacilli bacterium]|nr:cysteine--tRNA ligase [Bacilli bacterium]